MKVSSKPFAATAIRFRSRTRTSIMFRSARLKLTFFYLAILLAFSLTLTTGLRVFAERELIASNVVQRGEIQSWVENGLTLLVPRSEDEFLDLQRNQTSLATQHLNHYLVGLNLTALVVGGLLSYWYAGRTLKPIREAHSAQARFASDASHELRTPLTNIRAENEVFLRQKTFTEADARELINSNLEEVQRLENLSSDLLALTQYGQTQLPLNDIGVEDIAGDAIAQTDKTLQSHQVRIARKLEGAVVRGHRESLARLLVILLDNAVKYGPRKGTIYIAGQQHASHYVLTIRDEGEGIAEKDLPHIFERLYRGDRARTTSGNSGYGLGLALAQEIVKANHASIQAYNHPQGGAVFSVELPLASRNN